jgi:hypothetical protein
VKLSFDAAEDVAASPWPWRMAKALPISRSARTPQRRPPRCIAPRPTPRVLTAAYTDPDRAAAKRAFEAMMEMTKSTSRPSRRRG